MIVVQSSYHKPNSDTPNLKSKISSELWRFQGNYRTVEFFTKPTLPSINMYYKLPAWKSPIFIVTIVKITKKISCEIANNSNYSHLLQVYIQPHQPRNLK